MFRAWRRAGLTRRLAKRRIDPGSGPLPCTGDSGTVAADVANLLYSVVNLLDDRQLETLAEAVEMGYADGRTVDCVIATAGATWPPTASPPHVVCCRLWRWPTLDGPEALKCMPWCRCDSDRNDPGSTSRQNDRQMCCNPFHWSRLVLPDSPPPAYTKGGVQDPESSVFIINEDSSSWTQKMTPVDSVVDKSFEVDRLTDDDSSAVDISSDEEVGLPAWCRVSYWEMRRRIGRQFFVSTDWTNIFQDLPHGDGISLAILQQQNSTAGGPNTSVPTALSLGTLAASEDLSIKRTRTKIGRGLVLSRECDGVWIYNCSDYPVFVNSPLCSETETRLTDVSLSVRRLSSGQALHVLGPCVGSNKEVVVGKRCNHGTGSCCGCHSIQVSFAKGWGRNYSRQFVTACPCWIEVNVSHRHHHPIT